MSYWKLESLCVIMVNYELLDIKTCVIMVNYELLDIRITVCYNGTL